MVIYFPDTVTATKNETTTTAKEENPSVGSLIKEDVILEHLVGLSTSVTDVAREIMGILPVRTKNLHSLQLKETNLFMFLYN